MIKRMKARVWQGDPNLYKQYSKIDFFVIEDEKTKGYALYQRNISGNLVFKGQTTKFDLQEELNETVSGIRCIRMDLFTGNRNEFTAGKGRIFVEGDFNSVTEKQAKEYFYVYNDSVGEVKRVEFIEGMTSDDLINTVSEGCIYGGYYVTDIKSNGDTSSLPKYSEETAATEPCTLQKGKVYYVHEVDTADVFSTVILCADCAFIAWDDSPIQKANIGEDIGSKVDIISLYDHATTPYTPVSYRDTPNSYLLFDNTFTISKIEEDGITVTLSDGNTVNFTPTQSEIIQYSDYYLH